MGVYVELNLILRNAREERLARDVSRSRGVATPWKPQTCRMSHIRKRRSPSFPPFRAKMGKFFRCWVLVRSVVAMFFMCGLARRIIKRFRSFAIRREQAPPGLPISDSRAFSGRSIFRSTVADVIPVKDSRSLTRSLPRSQNES